MLMTYADSIHIHCHNILQHPLLLQDVDRSGSLDAGEWQRFLARFNSSVTSVNARSMFLHLDSDMSGSIECSEILPVVFNRASSKQQCVIRHLIDYANACDAELADLRRARAAAALPVTTAKKAVDKAVEGDVVDDVAAAVARHRRRSSVSSSAADTLAVVMRARLESSDLRRLFELQPKESLNTTTASHSGSGSAATMSYDCVRRMLTKLRIPGVTFEYWSRCCTSSSTASAGEVTAEQFANGFFEAFVTPHL
jgi:hypothetical protein